MPTENEKKEGSLWDDIDLSSINTEGKFVKYQPGVKRKFEIVGLSRVYVCNPKYGDEDGMAWLLYLIDLDTDKPKEWQTTSKFVIGKLHELGVDRGGKFEITKIQNEGEKVRWEIDLIDTVSRPVSKTEEKQEERPDEPIPF